VHASLLPRWRGAAPVHHAILSGDRQTGVTVMLMDEGMDTGPALTYSATPIGDTETTGDVTRRLAQLGADLLMETLPRWISGTVESVAQDAEAVTYAPRIVAEDGRLDWSEPARRLALRVRAMNPWPGAFTEAPDGKRLKVHAAVPIPEARRGDALPGTLLEEHGLPLVATGEGLLQLDRVQLEGKQAMAGEPFLRGRPQLIGSLLGAPMVTA